MPIDLTKYEGLPEELRAQIEADLQGYESPDEVAGLKASRDSLLAEKKEAADKAAAAEREKEEAKRVAAEKAGDIEGIKTSYERKLQEQQSVIDGFKKQAETGALDAAVAQIAGQLADGNDAELLKPFIRQRLRYDEGAVKVTDNSGALTISSLDDLQNEFRGDERFSKLIVASRASGGGANHSNNAGGAGENADLSGSTKEKANALAGKIPAFANLPVN